MIATRITHVVPWMVGALLLFSIMPVSIRELARGGLSIFEILPIRSGVALLVLLVLLAVRADLRIHARPRRMGLNNFRNTVHYASQFSWDTGVTGSIRLRHHHDCHQKADYDRINLRHNILDGGNPVSPFTRWQHPSVFLHFEERYILSALGVGTAGLTSHYCLNNAFRSGDATLVVPLDFMRIPLIAVVGWVFYGERLDIFVLFAALIIVSGVLWNLRSEVAGAHQ